MAITNNDRPAVSPGLIEKILKKSTGVREVVLTSDLYEAVLESIQQAKEGKSLTNAEVLRRLSL